MLLSPSAGEFGKVFLAAVQVKGGRVVFEEAGQGEVLSSHRSG